MCTRKEHTQKKLVHIWTWTDIICNAILMFICNSWTLSNSSPFSFVKIHRPQMPVYFPITKRNSIPHDYPLRRKSLRKSSSSWRDHPHTSLILIPVLIKTRESYRYFSSISVYPFFLRVFFIMSPLSTFSFSLMCKPLVLVVCCFYIFVNFLKLDRTKLYKNDT